MKRPFNKAHLNKMRTQLAEIRFHAFCITKSYLITKPVYSGIGTILMFHRVSPKTKKRRLRGNSGLEITPEYLESAIKFLVDKDYQIVSSDQMVSILRGEKTAKKIALFTFDDGYSDNLTYAYPIFKKYNIPFTINITTGFMNKAAVPWWYPLEDLVLKNDRLVIGAGKEALEFKCPSHFEKETVYRQISSIINDIHGEGYISRIKKIFDRYKVDIYAETDGLTLSWKEVEQLSRDPLVTIGAHTVNHFMVSKLPESDAKYEIIVSKRELESHIKRDVKHFAYSFGGRADSGRREFDIVKKAGFETALTTRPGNIFRAHKNHMECLPRASIFSGREEKNVQYLNLWTDGMIPCIRNRFKRIVTL
jgi:peptidoglycan/xylan/chitin deacetylase (PgdA/CDA1 family)